MASSFHFQARSIQLLVAMGRALAGSAIELLAPPRCAACDAAVASHAIFCPPCAASVERWSRRPLPAPGVPPTQAFGDYGGALATSIQRLKYRQHPELGRTLGELLRTVLRERRPSVDRVIPVPLHPRRLAERGYNQAALLARRAAIELERPLDTGSLARVRDTAIQARLGAGRRSANVAGAFDVVRPRRLAGRRVLLVDDVATTGATLAACARALREAGVAEVEAVVLAASDRGRAW